jgi:hypothetical protein
MALLQLIGANMFLKRLTGAQLSKRQINKATAYLRAKGIVFYDNWSKEHCLILDHANDNKPVVIESLKKALNA